MEFLGYKFYSRVQFIHDSADMRKQTLHQKKGEVIMLGGGSSHEKDGGRTTYIHLSSSWILHHMGRISIRTCSLPSPTVVDCENQPVRTVTVPG